MVKPIHLWLLTLAMTAIGLPTMADNSGRISGTIRTVDGDTFKGLIRWDKNEGSWVDILDGTRDRDKREHSSRSTRRKYSSRRSSVKLFGLDLSTGPDNYGFVFEGSASESGIRFGHLRSLEVTDDDRALLILKSGEEIELYNGSTDIGTSIREILIEDVNEGEVEFSWEDIELIEFSDAGSGKPSVFGERLYGTVSTRRGDEFTGFICWDVDELFEEDILDGEDRRRSRKVPFGRISSISRYSSSGAEVAMKAGDTVLLRGSNDVDEGNRGIIVCDPAFGQVSVGWGEFEKLEFKTAPRAVRYADFDGGRKLKGTVYTEDGEKFSGEICWDDDEVYSWELLNGNYRDMEFKIEMGLIKQIEKNSGRSSDVTVSDGRVFRLRGSNDVDEDNKGIIVTAADGDEEYIDWEEFSRVVFDNK
ncbi:MAG: hypothetical protein AB1772_09495 [Candidatus Zixiibacteriota bacterium]